MRGASAQALGSWVVSTKDGLKGKTVEVEGDALRTLPAEPTPAASMTELPRDLRAALTPLAEPIVAGATTPGQKAAAIEAFFHANFQYSLKVDLLAKEHPLVVLIKERRPAYCAYFASAMAALLRTQGIPARLVGGWALEDVNPLTGSSIVRERDAHAWVEAWIEEEGRFVTFDPTPLSSRGDALGLERGPLGTAFEALGSWIDDQVLEFKRSPSDYIADKATSKYLWGVIFLVVAWRVSLRFRGPRTKRARRAMQAGDPRLVELYRRYLKILRDRADIDAEAVETDDALVERVRRERGEAAGAAAQRFVDQYRLARYAGAQWQAEALEAGLEALERTLRAASKDSAAA
ncbi:MAG: transglutaminase-like domain-containing protein [Myxococcales bacterium]